ncbi:LysR family transcriptional regulator [Phaeobacter italicus]|uniref:LysR substrate-binding domain-containing protein n=1 Tax=Phaeobacter italicus TaxID=481446 RepID=UPI001C981167|nr:LysR substrate-binding domain-containing protein [Phaeobacter italicus]MBY5978218.1 LysR family transcriptional regulator [Phaeobacter italicus]MEC8572298.1 LysR substrate-binding domain-containing protein [Pseudomonadota bacterium]
MYQDLPPLTWLRAFDASARLRSFTLAAGELGLTPSAVSYQVRGLEAQLGHKLFRRSRKSLELTPLGHAYLPVVAKAFVDIDATTASLFGKDVKSEITIRCLASLNILWLVPQLERFKREFPNSKLRVLSSSWAEKVDGDAIDIDIRYGDGRWADGMAVPLLRNKVIAVAAPNLVASVGSEDLQELPLIELGGVVDTWQHFFAEMGLSGGVPEPVLKVDQSLIALEFAAKGLGAALVADIFARPYLQEGRLQRIGDTELSTDQGHYIVLPFDRNPHRADAAELARWLQAAARQDPLSGVADVP